MESFLTSSDKVQYIIKSFNLTKTLFVSSILIGEAYTGKKALVHYLFPNTPHVSGEDQKKVEVALETYDELIITNFEKLSNIEHLNFNNKRIIATADYIANADLIDNLFAFIYTMPKLIERPNDINVLKDLFIKKACKTLMLTYENIDKESIYVDLSQNTKSMKRSIYFSLVQQTMKEKDIENTLYQYFDKHLDGNNEYRKYLHLYERPLIRVGLKKFGSQLKLSQILGINRNTLRKKIHEHHIN